MVENNFTPWRWIKWVKLIAETISEKYNYNFETSSHVKVSIVKTLMKSLDERIMSIMESVIDKIDSFR